MPHFCYIHNGLYVSGEVDGCHEPSCLEFRDTEVPPAGVLTTVVPGGSKDTPHYKQLKDFDVGLDRYSAARKNGLQPDHTTSRGVDAAEARVASQERALKKLGGAGEELATVAGVDR